MFYVPRADHVEGEYSNHPSASSLLLGHLRHDCRTIECRAFFGFESVWGPPVIFMIGAGAADSGN